MKLTGRNMPRRRRRENIYVDKDEYMEVHVKWKDKVVIGKFDKSDLDKVNLFPWHAHYDKNTGGFYFVTNIRGQSKANSEIKMHRMLMCEPVNMVVDHIDADTTNNRRNNLRVITNAQNIQNKKGARRDSNTGIRGVNWHKPSNKWVARFQVDGKRINLGTFDDINEAEKAVKEARAKYMPFSKEALQ